MPNGAASMRSAKLRFATVPSVQLNMSASEKGFGAKFIKSDIIAPAKLDKPMPTRISVTIEPTRSAAMVRTAVAASAPAIAATGIANAPTSTRP